MKILFGTNHLFGWTGSEIQLSMINAILSESGFSTFIFADFTSGNEVVFNLFDAATRVGKLDDSMALRPDIAYVQHHSTAVQIRAVFPEVPILHAQLGVLPHLEKAPRVGILPAACLSISEEVERSSLVEREQLKSEPVDSMVFRNIVDDVQFASNSEIGNLKSIVLHSYKLDTKRQEAIHGAVEKLGIRIGSRCHASGSFPYSEVPDVLQQGEIVVASGRGAIEAMLCGRVPLIMANCGDDGLVTPHNFHDLMKFNFSGRFTSRQFVADDVVDEISKYKREYGPQLRALALEHFGKSRRAQSVVDLFKKYAEIRPREFTHSELENIQFLAQTYALQREFSRSEAWFRSQASIKAHEADLYTRDQRIREMDQTIAGLKFEMQKVKAQVNLLTDLFSPNPSGHVTASTPDRL